MNSVRHSWPFAIPIRSSLKHITAQKQIWHHITTVPYAGCEASRAESCPSSPPFTTDPHVSLDRLMYAIRVWCASSTHVAHRALGENCFRWLQPNIRYQQQFLFLEGQVFCTKITQQRYPLPRDRDHLGLICSGVNGNWKLDSGIRCKGCWEFIDQKGPCHKVNGWAAGVCEPQNYI